MSLSWLCQLTEHHTPMYSYRLSKTSNARATAYVSRGPTTTLAFPWTLRRCIGRQRRPPCSDGAFWGKCHARCGCCFASAGVLLLCYASWRSSPAARLAQNAHRMKTTPTHSLSHWMHYRMLIFQVHLLKDNKRNGQAHLQALLRKRQRLAALCQLALQLSSPSRLSAQGGNRLIFHFHLQQGVFQLGRLVVEGGLRDQAARG